jgi:hypothetical protein
MSPGWGDGQMNSGVDWYYMQQAENAKPRAGPGAVLTRKDWPKWDNEIGEFGMVRLYPEMYDPQAYLRLQLRALLGLLCYCLWLGPPPTDEEEIEYRNPPLHHEVAGEIVK